MVSYLHYNNSEVNGEESFKYIHTVHTSQFVLTHTVLSIIIMWVWNQRCKTCGSPDKIWVLQIRPNAYSIYSTIYTLSYTFDFLPTLLYDNAEVNGMDHDRYIHTVQTLHLHWPFEPTRCTGQGDLNFSVCVNWCNLQYYVVRVVCFPTNIQQRIMYTHYYILKKIVRQSCSVFTAHFCIFPNSHFYCLVVGIWEF